jgi:uncharacterized membrane protein
LKKPEPATKPGLRRPWTNFGTERLRSFSDGVFSIVITLLVLELKVPELAADARQDSAALLWELAGLWPKLGSYLASFIVVGIYWVAHHNMFLYVVRVNRQLLWLNLIYLMSVSLIAFSAAVAGTYPHNAVAVALYGLNLVLVGVVLNWTWHYAISRGLIDDGHHPAVIKVIRLVSAAPLLFYSLAALLAFVHPGVALAIYIIVPTVYILPGVIELLFEKAASIAEEDPR